VHQQTHQGATCEQPRAVAPASWAIGRSEACEWQRAAEIARPSSIKRGYLIVTLAGDQHRVQRRGMEGE
jgi:hypothetical protein